MLYFAVRLFSFAPALSKTLSEMPVAGESARAFAGLEKDVVLTGNINRIEIWSKEKWNENSNYDDMDAIAESMEEMGIVI